MIASDVGFQMVGDIPMEMLVPRTIFRRNAIASERILRLEKTQ